MVDAARFSAHGGLRACSQKRGRAWQAASEEFLAPARGGGLAGLQLVSQCAESRGRLRYICEVE